MQTQAQCARVCVCTCYHRTLPKQLVDHFFGHDSPDVLSDSYLMRGRRGGGRCSNSTALRFNLQRFIDVQYVLLFAHFIAASCFVADGGPL